MKDNNDIVRGNAEVIDSAKRQADPVYSSKVNIAVPPNAFLHPELSTAVFPKREKLNYIDFRSSASEGAKTARPRNFRKKERSQYATKVWTAEDLKEKEMEEMANLVETKLGKVGEDEEDMKEQNEENKVDEDVIENYFDKMNIGTRSKDVKMVGIADRSKAIRKKKLSKKKFKSYKIVNF